jgi:hypothetical protein
MCCTVWIGLLRWALCQCYDAKSIFPDVNSEWKEARDTIRKREAKIFILRLRYNFAVSDRQPSNDVGIRFDSPLSLSSPGDFCIDESRKQAC